MSNFQILDLSHARNIFAVGDIHAHFSLLESLLGYQGFDPEVDHLISVGDLIDRGPENERALEFCEKPWFHWVRGNHEELLQYHALGLYKGAHLKNGGQWTATVMPSMVGRISDAINDAPNILEVLVPSGRCYGFVHATFPSDDWNDAAEVADQTEILLWDREDYFAPKAEGIANIDHVYHGHTPLWPAVKTVANVSWIDTGVYRDNGCLSLLKLD